MTGVDNRDGMLIEEGWEHCKQSIIDVLTTPIGTRVLRREYGSSIHDLIDRPQTPSVFLDCIMAIAEPLHRWEPRFDVTNIQVTPGADGKAEINIGGYYKPENLEKSLSVPV